jgi:twitching motility two-component system response regulator PilH
MWVYFLALSCRKGQIMFFKHKRTVMIVDSSPTILYYHGILMKRMHYSVLSANDPSDALQIMLTTTPTLVLTGITFADMKGIDFIRKIKSNPRTRDVPVIVLTSIEDGDVRAACLKEGCVACLSKPVEPACLFWTVQDLTERKPRQYVRIKTAVKAVAGDGAGGPPQSQDYATTLSEGGLYLRTLSQRSKDEIIPITLFINGREIRAKAVVLYSMTMEAGEFKEPGMGLKFVDIAEKDRDFLRNFIREQLVAGIDINPRVKKAA